jgi:hypothetical protein
MVTQNANAAQVSDTIISGWLADGFVLRDGRDGQLTDGRPRAKNYTLVVYPEDLSTEMQTNDAWIDVLRELGYKLVVSPYHDKDINADGSKKKPHYHVLLQGGRNWITFAELKELVKNDFNGKGVAVPQKCSNSDGLKRYMTHIDNPEKFQYSKDDIRTFNGASIDEAYKISEEGKKLAIYDIMAFVREHEEMSNYYQLMNYAMDLKADGDSTWFDVLLSNSWTIERYISSRRNAVKDEEVELAKQAEKAKRESELLRYDELMKVVRHARTWDSEKGTEEK